MNDVDDTNREIKVHTTTRSLRPTEFLGDDGDSEVSRRTPIVTFLSGAAMGKVFEIGDSEVVLGRHPECDVVLDEDSVSRRHAKLVPQEDGSVVIEDMASTNGTFIDGQRVLISSVADGATIRIGSSVGLRFSFQDCVQARVQRQLFDAATQDGLTGIYNQRYFLRRLEEEFSFCSRHGGKLALVLLDVDRFKEINDTLGHTAGDSVLVALPDVVASAIRLEDVLCRYGGDELAILLREVTSASAAVFAERIRSTVEQTPIAITDYGGGKHSVRLTVSVGVAALDCTLHPSASALLAAADRGLHRAKDVGGNSVAAGENSVAAGEG
jgi:diguanylate cyclase (GGDEF)-like protein